MPGSPNFLSSKRVIPSSTGTRDAPGLRATVARFAAKILGVKDGQVALDTGNGKPTLLPMDRLSEADQKFIREWEAISVYFNPGYEPPRSIANTIEAGISARGFRPGGKNPRDAEFPLRM